MKASQVFSKYGMSQHYWIGLEKRFQLANRKAMVLFPKETDILHDPSSLLTDSSFHESVILGVNRLFLERGYNPLYFSRNNILRIREIKWGKPSPPNGEATPSGFEILDSS